MAETARGTGILRRRERISDEETERRMLEAAVATVNQTGLTVGLEHLSFEDLIRDARVSRSTAYRRWPYKDLFLADLLRELARASTPAAVASEESALPGLREIVLEHADWLRSAEGRRDLMLELMRLGAEHDFETVRASVEWRTYLALHATFLSVADEGLRADLQAALAESERAFIRNVASAWERVGNVFGIRIRPELGTTYETFAIMASAEIRGEVILALANPEVAARRVHAAVFGASSPADWSLPSLSIASLAAVFFEPDPAVEWNDDRIAAVIRAFETHSQRADVLRPQATEARP